MICVSVHMCVLKSMCGVFVCLCVHAPSRVCIYAHVSGACGMYTSKSAICESTRICAHMCVCMCACMYVWMCVWCVYMCTCECGICVWCVCVWGACMGV